MLDSIYVGMTGLQGYSDGLRVIANNTANMNTPGFKSFSLGFSDLFYNRQGAGAGTMQMGYGLSTTKTSLNFTKGELRSTGNTLDMAINGEGLFTLRDADGTLRYTRAGLFEFNADGVLVSRNDGSKVVGVDATGNPVDITTEGLTTIQGKATTTVKFSGNLSSAATTATVNSVKVVDSIGGEHLLTVEFTSDTTTTAGTWTVKVLDGTTPVGTGKIRFTNGTPDPSQSKVTINYAPAGVTPVPLVLDFSTNVTSFGTGTLSTLAFNSQDGLAPGTLTGVSVDAGGVVVMAYSNGQTVKGNKLSLARFDSIDAVEALGGNLFKATDSRAWHTGIAGGDGFGSVRSGVLELSNVDLSQEFSDLVIMQRGYQASSQIVSTANEMLQELFNMRGK